MEIRLNEELQIRVSELLVSLSNYKINPIN